MIDDGDENKKEKATKNCVIEKNFNLKNINIV